MTTTAKTAELRPLRLLVGANVDPNPNAGASGTVWQMNAALRRRGHVVDEIWADQLGRRIQHGNLHYLLELPRGYRSVVRQWTNQHAYDVIELNQPHAHLAALEHRRLGRPGVFVNRSHGHEVRSEEALQPWRDRLGVEQKRGLSKWVSQQIRRLLDRQWDLIARAADGFVVSCSEDRDFLIDRYRVEPPRIGLITQGVPAALLERPIAPLTPERCRRLIYVGQLAFFKAPHHLGQIVTQVLEAHPEATMTWVCSAGQHPAARALVGPAVQDRLRLVDWMPQERLLDLLDEHGVFLFPSYFEGFGKAPLEAMARGLAVVASAAGGMRDYIIDGTNGRLAPVGEPATHARIVGALINDVTQCQRLAAAARQTALGHTWDRCAADAETFYRQLLASKQGRP